MNNFYGGVDKDTVVDTAKQAVNVVKPVANQALKSDVVKEVLTRLLKYLIQGLAVAIASHYIPKSTPKMSEVLMIALTAASTFAILEMYAPGIYKGALFGTGFTIGQGVVPGL